MKFSGNAPVVWGVQRAEDGSDDLVFRSALYGLVQVRRDRLSIECCPELGDSERVLLELREDRAVLAAGREEDLRHFFLQRGITFPGLSNGQLADRL